MKGITRYKLTIISQSAVCNKFLGQIWSYAASLQISNSHSSECYVVIFCLYHRFERIFLSFLWFILKNAHISTQILNNSFKSVSFLHRIQQFPRNFLCWQDPGCIYLYSFKCMGSTRQRIMFCRGSQYSKHLKCRCADSCNAILKWSLVDESGQPRSFG